MTQIIDGKKIAAQIKEGLRKRVEGMKKKPKLAVVLANNDEASRIYVNAKLKACEEAGIETELLELQEGEVEAALQEGRNLAKEEVERLNADSEVTGILVQLPVFKGLKALEITELIDPLKDVDCLTSVNMGKLLLGAAELAPPTPKGVMVLLKELGVELKGKDAVIIGKSNIVGKPLAFMLLSQDATVTVCHKDTRNLANGTKQADVLITAAGSPGLIKADMVKPGAVVIDIGINRVCKEENKDCSLVGDVQFEEVKEVASLITPVPGGVGPMTVAMLLGNICEMAEKQQ